MVDASSHVQSNIDPKTVEGFGAEWSRFDQSDAAEDDLRAVFAAYFDIFPKEFLQTDKIGLDVGCGSGRWDVFIAPLVAKLICLDASAEALGIARRNLAAYENVEFLHNSVSAIPLPDESVDFVFSLGVLHHVPDTRAGIREALRVLKFGSPFLVYLYYSFDNRPGWYGAIWRMSNIGRLIISKLPFPVRRLLSDVIAASVYWPLARSAGLLEKCGLSVGAWPLTYYRNKGFYTMRTDALDRFGTHLEQRFSKAQIRSMLEAEGLTRVTFADSPPYWCAVGYKDDIGRR